MPAFRYCPKTCRPRISEDARQQMDEDNAIKQARRLEEARKLIEAYEAQQQKENELAESKGNDTESNS